MEAPHIRDETSRDKNRVLCIRKRIMGPVEKCLTWLFH